MRYTIVFLGLLTALFALASPGCKNPFADPDAPVCGPVDPSFNFGAQSVYVANIRPDTDPPPLGVLPPGITKTSYQLGLECGDAICAVSIDDARAAFAKAANTDVNNPTLMVVRLGNTGKEIKANEAGTIAVWVSTGAVCINTPAASGDGGAPPPSDAGPPSCRKIGQSCVVASPPGLPTSLCCPGLMCETSDMMSTSGYCCRPDGYICSQDSDCCTTSLCAGAGGTCCTDVGEPCLTDDQCCPGTLCSVSAGGNACS